MKAEPGPEVGLHPRLAGLHDAAGTGLRGASIGLLSLLLAFAGALCLPMSPWAALALPAGLALAAPWRGGTAAWAGAVLGLLAALLGMAMPVVPALLATAAVAATTLLAQD